MKPAEHPLFIKYPQLFREKDLPAHQTCMCWGIECGSGWDELLEDCCYKLHKLFTEAGLTGDEYPAAAQVKEKFGTLRFYMNSMSMEVFDRANEIIREAEAKSAVTCDVCGKAGDGKSDAGWISTRCEEHAPKPKTRFIVSMQAIAIVEGSVEVLARDAEEAKRLAIFETGNVEWKYKGLVENDEPSVLGAVSA